MRARLSAVLLGLAMGTACRSAPVRPASQFPYPDDISLRGFAEEALFGYGTSRTHRFDDYTKGSYHVGPLELAQELPKAAGIYKLDLKAVAVIGPYGGLWAYDVITVVQEKACVRVNWLFMPHARITVKRTGCVVADAAWAAFEKLEALASVESPGSSDGVCLVVARGNVLRQTPFDCYSGGKADEMEQLDAALGGLSSRLDVSYSSYPPVWEEKP